MKKNLVIAILLVGLLSMLAGCSPNSPIQINTPVPTPKNGTPAPDNVINVPAVSIQVYAPGPNPLVNTPDVHKNVAGVILGLWHGFISPITLVISFFNKDVQIYEVHNDGNQYNLGFMLGLIFLFVVFMSSSRRR